jgi:uncharacterized protein YrrD
VFDIKDTVRDFSFQIPSGNLTGLLMNTTEWRHSCQTVPPLGI